VKNRLITRQRSYSWAAVCFTGNARLLKCISLTSPEFNRSIVGHRPIIKGEPMKNCGLGAIIVGKVRGSIPSQQALLKGAAILAFLFLLSATGARAQSTAGIRGIVTDPAGLTVPNATVAITNTGTNIKRSVVTHSDGNYAFELLPVGTYSVSVEAQGFKHFQASSITLATGDNARVDAHLEVGAATQTIVVTSSEFAALQTASATVGSVITPTATQDLPLNGRNFINLVQLAPGAGDSIQNSMTNGTHVDDRRLTSAVSVNGLPESFNNFLLDGVDNNERAIATIIVKPAIDALEEVKVDTNMYDATVGRAGGAVINMTTKSGTNVFHGDAFEFARNAAFDAKDVFNTGPKPPFTQNNFGGSLGGRVIRNRAFFFADFEALRINLGQTYSTFVPTPCELGRASCNGVQQLGNFSDVSKPIYDPNTGLQYQSGGVKNVIPSGSISGISTNYASLIPTATTGCSAGLCSYLLNPTQTQIFYSSDARADFQLRPNQTFFTRYTINDGNSSFPGSWPGVKPPGINYTVNGNGLTGQFPGVSLARQQNVTFGYDVVARPTLLVDLRAAWSRFASQSQTDNAGHNVNSDFGGPLGVNLPGIAGTDGLAQVAFKTGGYSSLGDQNNMPTDYWDNNFQYLANLSWTKGAHTFKFGASVLRRNWMVLQQSRKGVFTFSNQTTDGALQTCTPGPACTLTGGNSANGNSFASFLVGLPITTLQRLSLNKPSYRNWETSAYFGDDFQATKRLTLNVGFHYDIFTPYTEKHDTISNFDPTNLAILESGKVQQAGQNGVPDNLGLATQHNMFQPRIGFAAVIGHNLVLRGGFGTSYFVSSAASPANLRNQPYGYTAQEFNLPFGRALPTPRLDFSLTCLVPACGATAHNSISKGMATNFQNAMVYEYNLALEKQFGANTFTAAWVGEPGRHLNRVIPDADIPAPPGVSGCTNVSEPGPCQPYFSYLPLTQTITLLTSTGSSSYNALNVVFARRATAGLTIQANYTYAQALADTGGIGGACDPCGLLPNNPRSDWGFSDYDVRHRVATTVNYELPFGKGMTGAKGMLAKGWQVNGIYSFESGNPFTALDDTDQVGFAGGVTDRPNMVAARYTSHAHVNFAGGPAVQWFDPSSFTLQQPGFIGNEERNQMFGPAEKTLSVSFFKGFPIRESMKLEFRTEVFNLTNTPNYAQPTVDIGEFTGGPGSPADSAGGFGYVTSSNVNTTPREIQLALKFSF
jgi:hypothetical protein